MAKMENQKLKLLVLKDYLEQHTDPDHPASIRELIEHLETRDIHAERKSIYRDIQLLIDNGCDIVTSKGKNAGYYLNAGTFDIAELKLLADAVLASKFLTERKSSELLRKLGTLTSKYRALELRRTMVVSGRVKSMNESVIYNVDELHEAIRNDSQIRFRYFEWDREKNRVFRRETRTASPYALCWDDSNYYLVAHTEEHGLTNFRVDKMSNIRLTGEKRVRTEETKDLDVTRYGKQVFGMFNGELRQVKMRFENSLAGVVIDRFGRDVMLLPDGGDHFTCTEEIMVSPVFYAWIASFGTRAKLLYPESVVRGFVENCRNTLELYAE
jgi:predicted DNA-binding transcriptional regulator YafY